ncbi:GTP pyrophosphokinase [Xanthomonas phage Xoo-sp13]|nr:GTP pyrophosphokinase [Xanthomonas phage Xoo-sp13]
MKTTLPTSVVIPEFIQNNDVFLHAAEFAHIHHHGVGQTREASGQPYIVHPLEVASLVYALGVEFQYPPEWLSVAVVAALLHDTIEDTKCTYNLIETDFGVVVRDTVFWLTDVVDKKHGNRRVRKELERVRLTAAPGRVKFVKCCDIIANARTVLADKPESAQMFLTEKMALIDAFVSHNRLYKGVDEPSKLDKQMLAKCRNVLVEMMDSVSKP